MKLTGALYRGCAGDCNQGRRPCRHVEACSGVVLNTDLRRVEVDAVRPVVAPPARDHVIRIDREGTAPRWVRSIGRTDDMGCTVTWHVEQARRFSEATAQRHSDRLQALLGKVGGTFSIERADPCAECLA